MTSPGTTTDDRLAEIQQRADAATAGPWSAADEHGLMDGAEPAWCVSAMDGEKYLYDVAYADGPNEAADAEFMAHGRQDIPWLVAELVSLRGQLEAATEGLVELEEVIRIGAKSARDVTPEEGERWQRVNGELTEHGLSLRSPLSSTIEPVVSWLRARSVGAR